MAGKILTAFKIVREARDDQRIAEIFRLGHADRLVIETRASAALGGKKLVSRRVKCNANHNFAIVFERDRHSKARISVSIIRRAVERIDDPFPGVLTTDYDSIARFLGQYRVLW